jgi:hypothetical protein
MNFIKIALVKMVIVQVAKAVEKILTWTTTTKKEEKKKNHLKESSLNTNILPNIEVILSN